MSVRCPSCRTVMQEGVEHGAARSWCEACGKVWFGLDNLDHYLASIVRQYTPAELEQLRKECKDRREALAGLSVVFYPHCLECEDRMLRRAFGGISGIITYVCTEHGVLVSAADLVAIKQFVAGGGEVLMLQDSNAELALHLDEAKSDAKALERAVKLGRHAAAYWYPHMFSG